MLGKEAKTENPLHANANLHVLLYEFRLNSYVSLKEFDFYFFEYREF